MSQSCKTVKLIDSIRRFKSLSSAMSHERSFSAFITQYCCDLQVKLKVTKTEITIKHKTQDKLYLLQIHIKVTESILSTAETVKVKLGAQV